jgi:alanine-glyoxylate transaminase / serine-glyoxylate transaminase / serine-pyruvate transaminase
MLREGRKMSERELLMIPGPIEFDPAVLRAQARPTLGHTSPEFIGIFGRALDRLREVFLSPGGQPLVVAGSGTLAMEIAICNLVEPGDKVLVIDHGYFGARMAALSKRYTANVVTMTAPLGEVVPPEQVEEALRRERAKVMTVTHVDTSTGVRADVKNLAALARRYKTLTVVDGVCATGGEEFRQDEWQVDVCLTASQKAIGVPPGLALLMVSPRALEAWRARKTPVSNYYGDWGQLLPVMQAYQALKPGYFGTPPVNLIYALEVSVDQMLAQGMEARFAWHQRVGQAFQAAAQALGLREVPTRPEFAAAMMSAWYYPPGLNSAMLGEVKKRGVVLAGGLHPKIRDQYFRIGHMGPITQGDILATIGAIEGALAELGYHFQVGAGLTAAAQALATTAAVHA